MFFYLKKKWQKHKNSQKTKAGSRRYAKNNRKARSLVSCRNNGESPVLGLRNAYVKQLSAIREWEVRSSAYLDPAKDFLAGKVGKERTFFWLVLPKYGRRTQGPGATNSLDRFVRLNHFGMYEFDGDENMILRRIHHRFNSLLISTYSTKKKYWTTLVLHSAKMNFRTANPPNICINIF